MGQTGSDRMHTSAENDVKAPNLFERVKEEIQALVYGTKKHHDKETHGTSEDIDENISVENVKAPNIFERAKEEIEALAETIHEKKQSPPRDSSSKQHG